MDMNEVGNAVTEINRWLDIDVPKHYTGAGCLAQDWARIAKIQEEAGEVVNAFIGVTGQNPRKGTHGSMDDVLSELADVVATAIIAIQHFTGNWIDTERILWDKMVSLRERVPEDYRIK